MPYEDPDPTDPMDLHGVIIETDTDRNSEMAACFIEEYMRMGYDRDRVLSLFRMPQYVGAHMAYQALGDRVLTEMIDEYAALWGGRRASGMTRRDADGNVTPS